MSESVVDDVEIPDESDHPPAKRIRLEPQADSAPNQNNFGEDAKDGIDFDPLQGLLEAGRKYREEEAEKQRKSSTNNNQDSDDGCESAEESESESEDEVPEASPAVKPEKKEKKGKKGKSGKKKKSSNMRRNIKEILKPEQLDDLTIAARKEEEERIQRIQLKQQQLKLLQLQQQQSQLLRESLNAPIIDTYPRSGHPFASPKFADDLLKRLIQKRNITVSLDGVPQRRQDDDDCILLSSDDEGDKQAKVSSHVPRSSGRGAHGGPSKEVISLSSGEEEDGIPMKDARLYDGASGLGRRGGDVESDDDCVIISPGPDGEDETEDKDECSQDLLNVPDNLGRVLVNVGHPPDDNDVYLAPQIAKIVKPHQIGGIRFLYDNVVESKDRFKQTGGFGCILAHAMGLGKTLQTVSFCDVLLRTVGKTVLIIVPINTIQNWLNEFNRYLPAKNGEDAMIDLSSKRRNGRTKLGRLEEAIAKLNDQPQVPEGTNDLSMKSELLPGQNPDSPSIGSQGESINGGDSQPTCSSTPEHTSNDGDILYRKFGVYLLNETVKSLQARERTIQTWTEKGGVLLIGYEMYRMLALKKLKKSTRKVMNLVHDERLAEADSLDKIYQCLVDPGPDCVICDEGHRIKNSGAGISQALKAIKTKRRVVLTGYPLQNNMMEYWCMVDFVRPNYLGTKAEFSNMFERPIQNGQCADSTYEDKRTMKYRSHVLHSLLEGFVQRRSHVVLRNALPHKEEWVFLVRLTPIQLKIYREFIRYLRDDLESDNASANPIKAFAVCCKIWNHPDVLYDVVKKNLDLEIDLDIDEVKQTPTARPAKAKRGTGRPRGRPPLNGLSYPSPVHNMGQFENGLNPFDDIPTPKSETSGISLEWAKPLFENYIPEVLENGVKFQLLFELIDETVVCGDKLLVFSQSLLTLDLIEVFLKKRLAWRKFNEYVRLDGSTAGLEREKIINEFNKSTVQKVFLISTRAGSLGINLVGANRVCIFDASWNPCHDSQAVCRVYRYGQTKPCHIYRFVADCTLEKRIYDRQVNKKGMADRIVDEMNPNTPFKTKDVSSFLVLQHDLLDKLPFIKCDLTLEKFGDPVMKSLLGKIGEKITQEPFEHESLLIDQKHSRLSKSEKRLALKNYEKEKQTVANAYATYSRPSYSQYYSSISTSMGSPSSSQYGASSSSRYTEHHSSYSSSHRSSAYREQGTSGESYSGSMGSASYDRFELHINALKSRGISVFPVQLHQDTYLNDPSGASNIYIRAGERVYLLVSQKGTYLRVQSKILRVPFAGVEMTQEQAEHYIMSLLQIPSEASHSRGYPAEQQLPSSHNMMYQKNANHLQITNSRSNSGGDVMMGSDSSNEGRSTANGTSSKSDSHRKEKSPHPNQLPYQFLKEAMDKMQASKMSSDMSQYASQSDLQSLSRLTEAFCQRSSPYSSPDNSNKGKQWCPSPSSKLDSGVTPPTDLEVIKLNRSHSSSNSSNSSNSRTNSPYSRQTSAWSNLSNEASSAWNTSKDPAFYTDFTITPLSRNNAASTSKQAAHQSPDNYWAGNNTALASNPSNFFPSHSSSSREAHQQQLQDFSFQGIATGSTSPFGQTNPLELPSHGATDLSLLGLDSCSLMNLIGNVNPAVQDSLSNSTRY